MNTTDNPQQPHDKNLPDPTRSAPNEPRERPEPVEAATPHTPLAVVWTSRPSWPAAPAPRSVPVSVASGTVPGGCHRSRRSGTAAPP